MKLDHANAPAADADADADDWPEEEEEEVEDEARADAESECTCVVGRASRLCAGVRELLAEREASGSSVTVPARWSLVLVLVLRAFENEEESVGEGRGFVGGRRGGVVLIETERRPLASCSRFWLSLLLRGPQLWSAALEQCSAPAPAPPRPPPPGTLGIRPATDIGIAHVSTPLGCCELPANRTPDWVKRSWVLQLVFEEALVHDKCSAAWHCSCWWDEPASNPLRQLESRASRHSKTSLKIFVDNDEFCHTKSCTILLRIPYNTVIEPSDRCGSLTKGTPV